jgi:hypothetical protein
MYVYIDTNVYHASSAYIHIGRAIPRVHHRMKTCSIYQVILLKIDRYTCARDGVLSLDIQRVCISNNIKSRTRHCFLQSKIRVGVFDLYISIYIYIDIYIYEISSYRVLVNTPALISLLDEHRPACHRHIV